MSELSIRSATYIGSHILEIKFSDGCKEIVDFMPFISSSSHPDYENINLNPDF